MKINGWKRIGIIASIAWVVGAYFVTFNRLESADMRLNAEAHAVCFETAQAEHDTGQWQMCERDSVNQAIEYLHYERREAALVALGAVPLAWGFGYLVIFLVGWVKRGFVQAKDGR